MASSSGTVPPLPPQHSALMAALAVLSLSFLLASSHPLPREEAAAAAACTYTVQIKTSCSSPRSSSPDAVSLAFGDAYRNEVYAARVSPVRGFERCATDTFRVSGPCGYGVCYLYLRRSGRVGWTPEWVRVYEPSTTPGGGGTPSTFYYGDDPLPDGVWYGFDRCVTAGAESGAATAQVL